MLCSLVGHSGDFQFECLDEETTAAAVQDHFDFPTSSSEQHALLLPVSGCSENSDSMSSSVVKQERPSADSVYIKFEVKQEQVCSEQDDSCVVDREPPENYFSHQKDSVFETRRPTSYSAQQTQDTRPSSDSWFRSMFFFLFTVVKAVVTFYV